MTKKGRRRQKSKRTNHYDSDDYSRYNSRINNQAKAQSLSSLNDYESLQMPNKNKATKHNHSTTTQMLNVASEVFGGRYFCTGDND